MPVDKFGRMSDAKTKDTGVSLTYINPQSTILTLVRQSLCCPRDPEYRGRNSLLITIIFVETVIHPFPVL